MRNRFKAAADELELGFGYGRKDFLNLIDNVDEDKIYIYADPPKITPIRSGTGVATGETVVGKFMLLKKASLDAKYDEEQNADNVSTDAKYQSIIEPMIPLLDEVIGQLENVCDPNPYQIKYSYTEVVNVNDLTLDGLLINYTATKN